MPRPNRIAIIGAGVGGLASAAFLSKAGHDVTILERFESPQAIGAGLLLQPTGLAVLARLGIDAEILASGSRIDQLFGKVATHRHVTLDVRYDHLDSNLFGIGIHRGRLFSALYRAAQAAGVTILAGCKIARVAQDVDKITVLSEDATPIGVYDLVIDASGANSVLRQLYGDVRLDKPYPYGAIWSVVNLGDSNFQNNRLDQRYVGAHKMIGILPVGQNQAAFFYSMKVTDYQAWRDAPLSQWQESVTALWPETAPLVAQFQHHADLTLASYRDVILRQFHSGRLVFIGDSAHCTSPQLGQGANLALLDAMTLAESIDNIPDIPSALAHYSHRRRPQIAFYQMVSRALTPFFQSDSRFFPMLRPFMCGGAVQVPFLQQYTASILTGVRTGFFSKLDDAYFLTRNP